MTKYSGKTLFLEEQPDGRYTLYNWYHSPIATEELEELVPIIRAWGAPTPVVNVDQDFLDLVVELDEIHFNLDDLT